MSAARPPTPGPNLTVHECLALCRLAQALALDPARPDLGNADHALMTAMTKILDAIAGAGIDSMVAQARRALTETSNRP